MVKKTVMLDADCDHMVRLLYGLLLKVDKKNKVTYSLALNTMLISFFYHHALNTTPATSQEAQDLMRTVVKWVDGSEPTQEHFDKFSEYLDRMERSPAMQEYVRTHGNQRAIRTR